ncbi:hypothetical protein M8494_16640 [Serratia ureilytica]
MRSRFSWYQPGVRKIQQQPGADLPIQRGVLLLFRANSLLLALLERRMRAAQQP